MIIYNVIFADFLRIGINNEIFFSWTHFKHDKNKIFFFNSNTFLRYSIEKNIYEKNPKNIIYWIQYSTAAKYALLLNQYKHISINKVKNKCITIIVYYIINL